MNEAKRLKIDRVVANTPFGRRKTFLVNSEQLQQCADAFKHSFRLRSRHFNSRLVSYELRTIYLYELRIILIKLELTMSFIGRRAIISIIATTAVVAVGFSACTSTVSPPSSPPEYTGIAPELTGGKYAVYETERVWGGLLGYGIPEGWVGVALEFCQ